MIVNEIRGTVVTVSMSIDEINELIHMLYLIKEGKVSPVDSIVRVRASEIRSAIIYRGAPADLERRD